MRNISKLWSIGQEMSGYIGAVLFTQNSSKLKKKSQVQKYKFNNKIKKQGW